MPGVQLMRLHAGMRWLSAAQRAMYVQRCMSSVLLQPDDVLVAVSGPSMNFTWPFCHW